MPHSQGLFNNPYPEPNQLNSLTFILTLSSHLRLGLKGLFPVVLPAKILEAFIHSSILAS